MYSVSMQYNERGERADKEELIEREIESGKNEDNVDSVVMIVVVVVVAMVVI